MELHPVKFGRKGYRKEYLKSEEWGILREKILRKCDYKCEKCGNRAGDVHHMDYRILGIPGLATKDFLIALCRPCHDLVEEAVRIELIPSPHHRGHINLETEKSLAKRKRKLKTKKTWDSWMVKTTANANEWQKVAICAVMKRPVPESFSEWIGIELSPEMRRRVHVICGHKGRTYAKDHDKFRGWRAENPLGKTFKRVIRERQKRG